MVILLVAAVCLPLAPHSKVMLSVGGACIQLAGGLFPSVESAYQTFQEESPPRLTLSPSAQPWPIEVSSRWGIYDVATVDSREFYQAHSDMKDHHVAVMLSLTQGTGQFYRAGPDPFSFGHPLDRYIFARLLAERGRVMLHAAGVILQGKGVLLGGVSGAGKTTLAGRMQQQGHPVLSDERVVVGMDADQALLWGTPWSGDGGQARPGPAPLGTLIFLERGTQNSLDPLSPAMAAGRLLSLSTLPYWHPEALQQAVDGVKRVVLETPAFILRSTGDGSAVAFLEQRL